MLAGAEAVILVTGGRVTLMRRGAPIGERMG